MAMGVSRDRDPGPCPLYCNIGAWPGTGRRCGKGGPDPEYRATIAWSYS